MNGPADHPTLPAEDAICRHKITQTLAQHGLKLTPKDGTLLTPSRLARLYPGSGGAIYGGSPEGALAAFQRPTARTLLKGLYLAGDGAHPGAGVPMAILSGQHATEAIWQDQISPHRSRPADMAGGMSTASRTTEPAPSRSSPS